MTRSPALRVQLCHLQGSFHYPVLQFLQAKSTGEGTASSWEQGRSREVSGGLQGPERIKDGDPIQGR